MKIGKPGELPLRLNSRHMTDQHPHVGLKPHPPPHSTLPHPPKRPKTCSCSPRCALATQPHRFDCPFSVRLQDDCWPVAGRGWRVVQARWVCGWAGGREFKVGVLVGWE